MAIWRSAVSNAAALWSAVLWSGAPGSVEQGSATSATVPGPGGRVAISLGHRANPGSASTSAGSHSGGASTNPATSSRSPGRSRSGSPRRAWLPAISASTICGSGQRSTRQRPIPVRTACWWTSGPGRSGLNQASSSGQAAGGRSNTCRSVAARCRLRKRISAITRCPGSTAERSRGSRDPDAMSSCRPGVVSAAPRENTAQPSRAPRDRTECALAHDQRCAGGTFTAIIVLLRAVRVG